MKDPGRILVINVTRIGDTLLTTPVLRALSQKWPQAEITFAGHAKRIEILQHLPYIHRLRSIGKRRAAWLGRAGLDRYDLALVYGNDTALLEYALRVAFRVIAFRQDSASINDRLFAIGGEDGYQPTHAVTWLMQLLRPLGVAPAGFQLDYRISPEEDAWAKSVLHQSGKSGRPLIGLQVASFPTKSFRDWPLESFSGLCALIVAEWPDAHFLIFGGSLEAERTAELQRHLGWRASRFAGKLSLRQTAALMQQIDLYVGVDTGPTHIMGALHRPMIAMYHPTSPKRALAPLGHPCCHAIDHPLADLPQATSETPMSEIGIEQVWQHTLDALCGRNTPPPLETFWR